MFTRSSQRGQALVLIAFAMIGLLAITALAIDAGNAFAARRRAQSAVDDAALAGGLAILSNQDIATAVYNITRAPGNNFPDAVVQFERGTVGGSSNRVLIQPGGSVVAEFTNGCSPIDITQIVTSQAPDDDPYGHPSDYLQVYLRSSVDTYFGPVIGINQIDYCVQAIVRSKPLRWIPPFYGNAIVGLNPDDRSFDAHSNAQYWNIWGGGIFANNDAEDIHGNVVFPDGHCVTAVGETEGFDPSVCTLPHMTDLLYHFPEDILPLLPPTPPCDGIAEEYDDQIHEQSGYEGRGSRVEPPLPNSFAGDYAPGVYCIMDAGGVIHDPITGSGVTFYIADTDFKLTFDGHGYIAAQAPTDGIYQGVLIFSDITETPLTQDIQIRGNGSTPIIGSIILPSAHIDWYGNGVGDAMQSMVVGYEVWTNGTANVDVVYNERDNWRYAQASVIELTK